MSAFTPRGDKSPVRRTDWTRYKHYTCKACGDPCINHRRESCAHFGECRSCHTVADLDQLDELDDLEDDPDAPASRQADRIPRGAEPASERSERDSAPGRNARQRSASEQPGPSPGIRSERSEVPVSTPIGDAADRLAYRRDSDE